MRVSSWRCSLKWRAALARRWSWRPMVPCLLADLARRRKVSIRRYLLSKPCSKIKDSSHQLFSPVYSNKFYSLCTIVSSLSGYRTRSQLVAINEEQNSEETESVPNRDSSSRAADGDALPSMQDLIEEAKAKDAARDRTSSDMNLVPQREGRNHDSLSFSASK